MTEMLEKKKEEIEDFIGSIIYNAVLIIAFIAAIILSFSMLYRVFGQSLIVTTAVLSPFIVSLLVGVVSFITQRKRQTINPLYVMIATFFVTAAIVMVISAILYFLSFYGLISV